MKTKKHSSRNFMSKILQSVTLLILMTVITNSGGTFNTFANSPMKAAFTGEQVFRGVILGEGSVAELFPEVWKSSEVKQQIEGDKAQEWKTLKENIISEIKLADPTFMDRFGQEMQSGEPLRIQATMEECRQTVIGAVKNLRIGTEKAKLQQTYPNDLANIVIVFVILWDQSVLDVDLIRNLAVQTIAIFDAIKVAVFLPSETPTDSSRFSYEQFVNSAADRLVAAE